jgi:hypothetical protein
MISNIDEHTIRSAAHCGIPMTTLVAIHFAAIQTRFQAENAFGKTNNRDLHECNL